MYNFAVVVTFSFSEEVSVLLFNTYEEALEYLKKHVVEEYLYDIEDCGFDSEYMIDEDGGRATLTLNFDGTDNVTEWRIATVYDPKEEN